MAIQVNGTEVISNSRALNNIASVDATTATAIGAAGVGGFTETIFNRPTSSSGLLTTVVNTDWKNTATQSSAPTAADGLFHSWTLTSSKTLAALVIKTDMSKITWNQIGGGYWSGGVWLWLYDPDLPSGAQYVNILGHGQAVFNIDLAGGDTPPNPPDLNFSKSLALYGANSVLYLIGGKTYDPAYGGITVAADWMTINSYTSALS